MIPSDNTRLLAALSENWQAEMEGFSTYSSLAKNESDPHRRNALRGLATAEKHHADLWAGRIKALGGIEPQYRGDPAGQAASLANRVGGPDLALRRLEIDEGRDIAKYGKQIKALGAREREAVEENEAEGREVLSLSYQIRGLPEEDAKRFVEHLARDKEQLIRALARERMNTTEEGLSKPWVSAVSGALSTAVGAFIPIIPFFFICHEPLFREAKASVLLSLQDEFPKAMFMAYGKGERLRRASGEGGWVGKKAGDWIRSAGEILSAACPGQYSCQKGWNC